MMKTKLGALLAVGIFVLGAGSSVAGPRGGVFVNVGGGYCPPVRPICVAPIYSGPSYRCYPTSCYYPQPAFYSWGPSVVVYSTGPSYGFSNVSPILNYAGGTPVYTTSPPVVPAPPIVVGPASTFRWRP